MATKSGQISNPLKLQNTAVTGVTVCESREAENKLGELPNGDLSTSRFAVIWKC